MLEQVAGDRAYGTGKVRHQVAQATDGQTQVMAYLPDFESRSDQFGPSDFTVDWGGEPPEMTYPKGQTTGHCYRHGRGDGYSFRFTVKEHCQGCPLWEPCRQSESSSTAHRTVFVSDYRAFVKEALVFNQTETFKEGIRQRAGIERIIYNLTNLHGGRVARSVGLLKAQYQSRWVAVAFNIRQMVRLKVRAAM